MNEKSSDVSFIHSHYRYGCVTYSKWFFSVFIFLFCLDFCHFLFFFSLRISFGAETNLSIQNSLKPFTWPIDTDNRSEQIASKNIVQQYTIFASYFFIDSFSLIRTFYVKKKITLTRHKILSIKFFFFFNSEHSWEFFSVSFFRHQHLLKYFLHLKIFLHFFSLFWII